MGTFKSYVLIMKRVLLLVFIILTISSFSQISQGGEPLRFSKTLLQPIPIYTIESVDVQSLKNEDAITDSHKDIPWRFGTEIPVDINLNNSGVWETLANGDRVWQLTIKSENAVSINLNYSHFDLPNGATFFVYNKNNILGCFNKTNNKSNGEFATTLIKGDHVTIEYFEPKSAFGKGFVQISSVVHGYRDLFGQLKVFGSSESCNINAVCDNEIWQDEIRSTVMILTAGNTRFCTGALINNVLQDGTPYVLTANHCGPASNNIFMFNYQSANCSPSTDGPTNQTINGCSLIASNFSSDFSLVRLTGAPPPSFNVFYAGWSNVDEQPTKGTGIHHPRGDVKKISHDTDPLLSSSYYSAGNDHWQVLDWNTGTTESGSSGSPLFDQNHRFIGQLHGGNANCGNDEFDYYGKFATAWETNPDTLQQLKHWLDPSNTGETIIEGWDPNGANFTTDVFTLSLEGIPNLVCGDSASPKITIKNRGSNPLTAVDIVYSLDNTTPSTVNWTGNLPTFGTTTISLPVLSLTNGSHNFSVYTSLPNNTTDQNPLNDSISFDFIANISPLFATFNLTTDDYGSELSWLVRDNSTGNTILEGGGYPDVTGGQTTSESLCLYDGCFDFVIRDGANDGYCCSFGTGNLLLTEDATGDTLANDNSFSGGSLTFPLCIGSATNIDELTTSSSFNIYPNPNSGKFSLDLLTSFESPIEIDIYNMVGQSVYHKQGVRKNNIQINLENVQKGIYVISITSNKKRLVERMLID